MESQKLNVIHLVGSNESDFYFSVSYLYAKACLRIKDKVNASYIIVTPKDDAFLVVDSIQQLEVEDFTMSKTGEYPNLKKKVNSGSLVGPMSLLQILSHPMLKLNEVDLVVPHMFDVAGMSTYRALFEDILKISVAGPGASPNILAQNKIRTREVLAGVGVSLPEGQVLRRADFLDAGELDLEKAADAISMKQPFVIKAPTEDNSRGVFLQKKNDSREKLMKSLKLCFGMGNYTLIEEFIPGREIRAAGLENEVTGEVELLPALCEYHLGGDDNIRTLADKLQTDESEGCDSKDSEYQALSNHTGTLKQTNKCVKTCPAENISEELIKKITVAVQRSHEALGMRDYSIFDFRVHAVTGEPYVIESCSFWSYSPISFISVLHKANLMSPNGGSLSEKAADESLEKLVLNHWQRAARRTNILRNRTPVLKGTLDGKGLLPVSKINKANPLSKINKASLKMCNGH